MHPSYIKTVHYGTKKYFASIYATFDEAWISRKPHKTATAALRWAQEIVRRYKERSNASKTPKKTDFR